MGGELCRPEQPQDLRPLRLLHDPHLLIDDDLLLQQRHLMYNLTQAKR